MPVTIRPTPDQVGVNKDFQVTTNAALLVESSKAWTVDPSCWWKTNKKIGKEDREILTSSFQHDLGRTAVVPYGNGPPTVRRLARNHDTKFGMFINGHAEDMRSYFVSHEGKREIVVDIRPLGIRDIDMDKVAVVMTHEIQKHVLDPELREWMVPSFTTTTETDAAVASFAMMGALKKYFEDVLRAGCGFPSVTLLGEKSDWEAIAIRAKKLSRYGAEPLEWSRLLQPILDRMVQSFESPDSAKTKEFWLRACYEAGADGSGSIATLSGWITAFCFWDEDGRRTAAYKKGDLAPRWAGPRLQDRRPLVLDGVSYPLVSPSSVPKAFISVPMLVQDYASMTNHDVTVAAGHVGVTLTENRTKAQPLSGWWMLLDQSKPMHGQEAADTQIPV